jgi:Xaa-Pro aminopeptidase
MVKLSTGLLFGTAMADYQERINVTRMREERATRLRKTMKKYGLAACLLTRVEDQRYATGIVSGYDVQPQADYTLFFAEGDPVVYQHAGAYQQLPDQVPWIKEMRIARGWLGGAPGKIACDAEAKIFAQEIADEIRSRGLAGEEMGVNGLDAAGSQALAKQGVKLRDCTYEMLEARTVKTADEINCIKMAAAIADAGFYKSLEAMKPGVRDVDLTAVAVKAVYEAGADGEMAINFFSGPYTFERGLARTGRIIQYGDLVYCDHVGVSFLGYKTCYYRTFLVGRDPTDKEKDWYKRLLDRIDAVIDAIRPGATTADAAKQFEPASRWGYASEVEQLTVEIGHGIGLKLYEMPIINRQWSLEHPQVFEAGMVLAVEGREGEWRVGGVRLEDMVVITEDGPEIITRMPRDRIMVANKIL